MGPLRLKRLCKDQASHRVALGTSGQLYFEEEKKEITRTPKLGFGVRNGQKMVKNYQMPKYCMRSSYFTNYYPDFIDFMTRQLDA